MGMFDCFSNNGGNGRQRRGPVTHAAINFANEEKLYRRIDQMTVQEHGVVSAALKNSLGAFSNNDLRADKQFRAVIVAGDKEGRVKIAQSVSQSYMGPAYKVLHEILNQDTVNGLRKLN